MSDDSQPGQLDLIAVFEAVGKKLLTAVQEGRILHKTYNIAGSGAPFEEAFREFLRSRIPAPFVIDHGYLFDPRSNCTPQIDVIISDSEAKSAMFVGQDGANYIPFTAAYVIGEVKSSGSTIEKHIQQLSDRIKSFNAMRSATISKLGSGNQKLHDPMSFLIIGDADKADYDKIKLALTDRSIEPPKYIVLLNKAELIASTSEFFELDTLHYAESGEKLNVYVPDPTVGGSPLGRMLLWFFYSIIFHLHGKQLGRGIAIQFSSAVLQSYPMKPDRTL
ncbi:DUF6602 domain-containing protein [Bosea sp. 2KB_26]|uniref:DUF6602 domain-containing protein n=1 Tax=Bosea sp. 2KB_26 TaxID=3237475 RepID=UPI003F9025D7